MQDWARIEELFQAALALPRGERPAFVQNSCQGREDLQREVQELLDRADSQDGFLEGSPLSAFTPPPTGLAPGAMLGGRFQIVERVGRGGMGDVYKATDTRLNRTVALKICRERFTERFEREARAIASLTHPHICTLYDVGPNYLVMEFIDGQPIHGPLPLRTALQYGIQAAGALSAAHKKGVIHRDCKPGNVLIGPAGVKLVDFGLAKMTGPGDGATLETLTEANQIPGTLRYMAPEQLDGNPADARSDIFAFGLVLHEAITGAPVFAAASQASVISSIMKDDPPPPISPEGPVPPALLRVLNKCLAKDPDARWQTAADLRDELQWIAQLQSPSEPANQPQTPPPATNRPTRRLLSLGALAVAIAVAGVLAWQRWTPANHPITGIPVVVLMDTSAPSGVYDPETRKRAGTNADDLTEALRDLPVSLVKETAGATWNREDQLANQQASLVLIHRSVFVHALDFEFHAESAPGTHKLPWPDPDQDDQFYARLSRIGRDKLDTLLGNLGAANSHTRFIVYAREWSPPARRKWLDALEHRFPILQARVQPFELLPEEGIASFRRPSSITRIRQAVAETLSVPLR